MSDMAQELQVCHVLSTLPEKFVVDFANGIDVVRDHNAVLQQRSGMFARLYDNYTGTASRRQQAINASLADGVAGSLAWLTELSASLASSNLALAKVQHRVASLQGTVAEIANYAVDTQEQLVRLSAHLSRRCDQLSSEVERIDLRQRASLQLDVVMSKWQSGHFASLSIAGRCYASLEELRWGSFGDWYRSGDTSMHAEQIALLRNRIISLMIADTHAMRDTRVDTARWLQAPEHALQQQVQQGIAYLADWSMADSAPFVHATAVQPQEMPDLLPRRCSAERISYAMIDEVFQGELA